jgi:hypothetical protein
MQNVHIVFKFSVLCSMTRCSCIFWFALIVPDVMDMFFASGTGKKSVILGGVGWGVEYLKEPACV